jgi:hypothetical protein
VARPIAPHRKLAGQHRHRRIMARFVVVVHILIARRDPRADHFSPPIKKSGGTERIPSGGAGSHVLGFLAACAGSPKHVWNETNRRERLTTRMAS